VSCTGLSETLHAYLDGELDAARRVAFEEHLLVCPACARELEAQQAIQTALRDGGLRYRPPAGLEGRVRAGLRAAGDRPRLLRRSVPWLAAAAVLVGAGLAGWGLWLAHNAPTLEDRVALAVTDAHARSLQADTHLVDKLSDNRHQVGPWFPEKVGFRPPVPDLKGQDFELVGGRQDYLDRRPVAAVVYRRRLHFINLFVWPEDGGETPVRTASQRGYHLCHWRTKDGLACWAVSDLNAEELNEFAALVRDGPPPAPAP
jgi:anti-sigma factor RsiW